MRGGKRKGAGRKPGSATKRTREIADKAAKQGITPLEVMLNTMRFLWGESEKAQKKKDIEKAKETKLAASAIAKDAAPYIHSRMPIALVPPQTPDQEENELIEDQDILSRYISGLHEETKRK